MSALFITGATGFVGRRVLAALPRFPFNDVRCLTRRTATATSLGEWQAGWHAVEGDLLDGARYQGALPHGGTVVHLAGAVGKTSAREFERQNVGGTAELIRCAAAAGVSHLVFISSIAAKYEPLDRAPYGRSKFLAEALVRAGPLSFTILRPTMVFGQGSANLASLERLALLPKPVLFGTGNVLVQPVDVEDLADVICHAAAERWPRETVDVGGPEVMTLEALLGAIRQARGRSPSGALHLPYGPVSTLLALVEPMLLPILPFTAGQLAAFANSTAAAPSERMAGKAPSMKTVRAMLASR